MYLQPPATANNRGSVPMCAAPQGRHRFGSAAGQARRSRSCWRALAAPLAQRHGQNSSWPRRRSRRARVRGGVVPCDALVAACPFVHLDQADQTWAKQNADTAPKCEQAACVAGPSEADAPPKGPLSAHGGWSLCLHSPAQPPWHPSTTVRWARVGAVLHSQGRPGS